MINLFDAGRNRTLILRAFFCILVFNFSGFLARAQTRQDSLSKHLFSKRFDKNDSTKTMLMDSAGQFGSGKNVLPFTGDSLFRSPWGALVRSFIVPGWGQWYNDAKLKAPVFLAGDVAMIGIYIHKNKSVRRIENQRTRIDRQIKSDPFLSAGQKNILQNRFNNLTNNLDGALTSRNLYGWFFAISHLLGMIDAYVDAHLFNFNDKMDFVFDPSGGMHIRWCIKI